MTVTPAGKAVSEDGRENELLSLLAEVGRGKRPPEVTGNEVISKFELNKLLGRNVA